MDVYQKPAGSNIPDSDDENFRSNGVGINNLNYGATYYPYLKTSTTVSLYGQFSNSFR